MFQKFGPISSKKVTKGKINIVIGIFQEFSAVVMFSDIVRSDTRVRVIPTIIISEFIL